MEAGIAARGDVDHRRDVEIDHLLVDRVPMTIRQRWRGPVSAGGVGIEVDADEAVLFDAFFKLGNAGRWIDAGRLRQHRRTGEIVGEQLADAPAQLVANRSPRRRHLEVADVMGHEACARAEDGQIAAALLHLPELVVDDGLAQLVVADLQLARLGSGGGILDARDLPVAPILEGLGRCGVVAVHIDDHVISLSVTAAARATRLVPTAGACSFDLSSSKDPGRTGNPITLARDPRRREIWSALRIAAAMAPPDRAQALAAKRRSP